jgi:formate hydrogenlyase subunit 3/multisubunit Na+/H+ antiporter MnhD subunit
LNQILAILPILLPILGAAASFAVGFVSRKARDATIVLSLFIALGVNSYLLGLAISGNTFSYATITANAAGLFVSEITLLTGLFIAFYAIYDMKKDSGARFFHMILLIFIGSMTGLTLSFDLVAIFAFLETSTATGGILILFGRKKSAVSAAVVYIVMSITGAIFILIGIFFAYASSGTMFLYDPRFLQLDVETRIVIAALFILGFSIKAGALPLGLVWLPGAYAEAPIPVCASLSVLEQCAAFAMIRSIGPIALSQEVIGTSMLYVGVASALLGVVFATLETFGVKVPLFGFRRDLKRVLGFSTMDRIGIIFIMGGLAERMQISPAIILSAALIHMLTHALAKSSLFLSSGNVVRATGTSDLGKLGGLARRMPLTTFSFVLAGLSLTAVPPLLGYQTILDIYVKFFNHQLNLLIASIFTAAGINLAFYLATFYRGFFRKKRNVAGVTIERNIFTVAPIFALDIILLVLGLGLFFGIINFDHTFIERLGAGVIGI